MAADQLKFIILGKHAVGKTSLIHRYAAQEFSDNTHEMLKTELMEKRLTVDGRNVYVSIWDPSAFESAQKISESFYDGAHGCCLVFSTVDKKSFTDLLHFYNEVIDRCGDGIPFVIAENKIDLIEQSVMDSSEVESVAKRHKLRLYRVSAKENHNVDDLFQYLIEKCLKIGLKRSFSAPRFSSPFHSESSTHETSSIERSNSAEPSRRRTGGVKPVFNRHKCPMM